MLLLEFSSNFLPLSSINIRYHQTDFPYPNQRERKRKMGSTNFLLINALSVLPFFSIMSFAVSPPTVNIISNVGTGSSPVRINCKFNGFIAVEHTFVAGDKFAFQASRNGTYYCTAILNSYFAGIQSLIQQEIKAIDPSSGRLLKMASL
jgi:hypothetical protein